MTNTKLADVTTRLIMSLSYGRNGGLMISKTEAPRIIARPGNHGAPDRSIRHR